MGRRGPQPRAASLAVLHGTRPDRIADTGAPATDEPMIRPPGLPERAARVWAELAPEAERLGARLADSAAFARLCVALARLDEVEAVIDAEGVLVEDADGTRRRHPLWTTRRSLEVAARSWLRDFRLVPGCRPSAAPGPLPVRRDPGRLLSPPV
jgi:hypothetical protein